MHILKLQWADLKKNYNLGELFLYVAKLCQYLWYLFLQKQEEQVL